MNNQVIKSNKIGGGGWGNHKIKLKRLLEQNTFNKHYP